MLMLPLIGAGLAGQFMKFGFHSIREGRWRPSSMVDFESFPSFHPLVAGCLCYQVAQDSGWGSAYTALCLSFTAIIVYDTSGMKRAAGKQAKILKRLDPRVSLEYRLSDILGQGQASTWIALFAGALLGILFERSWLAMFGQP